jgi:F0F1-type ATP synthase assembly protein I
MNQPPPSISKVAGVGFSLVGSVVVGVGLGLVAAKLFHWDWAVPIGVLLGFVAGFVAVFRSLREL